jgi:type I restriction enzyme S subunit
MTGKTDSDFVALLLRTLVPRLIAETSGSTFPNLPGAKLSALRARVPPLEEQRRIAARLRAQLDAVERARRAAEVKVEAARAIQWAAIRESFKSAISRVRLADVLTEVSAGVGENWSSYRVLGATRDGLADAKEPVGKRPDRYKLVRSRTIFYNPMRILIGSIAMLDEGELDGITSPDYVVFQANAPVLHHRWFYAWLRSPFGERFVRGLARGAVRERLLFRRLASSTVEIPQWDVQRGAADLIRGAAETEKRCAAELASIEALPAALLREAFREGS